MQAARNASTIHPKPAEIARVQCGVLTPAQLIACGVPKSTIAHRCARGGRWQRSLPRTVTLHNGPLSWQQRYWAAVLYGSGGGRGVVTGHAALSLYRMTAARPPEQVADIDVLVPRASHVRSQRAAWQGYVRILRTRRMPTRVRMNGHLPVAPLVRAATDAARDADLSGAMMARDRAAAVLYELVQARGTEPTALAAELRARRVAEKPWVRDVLHAVGAGVRSPAEADARTVLKAAALPQPLWNVRLYLDGRWLADPDAYWPRHGVLFEVDSATRHASRDGWERTMARHNRIEAAGLTVLHASLRQLRREPETVTTAVRQALAGGPYGPWERVLVRPPR